MSADQITATRTYLEITDRPALCPGRVPAGDVRVARRDPCEPLFLRQMYATVGAAYNWVDRLSWSEEEIQRYLADPGITVWVLTVGSRVAGYFELRREDDTSAEPGVEADVEPDVEIVYFGLLPEFTGRGLGGYLLSQAVERAWTLSARRVWLHTCSFDHPFAIQNYLDRGFTVFKTEQYLASPPVSNT